MKLFNLFKKKNKDKTTQLLNQMNNVEIIPDVEYIFNEKNVDKILNLLVIGNSLSFHGLAPEIGWNNENGMAATEKDKDYVHQLANKIATILPQYKIVVKVVNLADFERNYEYFNYKRIEYLKKFTSDIIVFQLGDNVRELNKDIFLNKFLELIKFFNHKNLLRIICTPFFNDVEKNNLIHEICLESKSYCVDLSSLSGLDNKTLAQYDTNYKNEGVKRHPGNYSMKKIADLIFIPINNFINSEYGEKI